MFLSLEQIKSILNTTDRAEIESLARKAAQLTEQYFGRTISLYAPLYLSNHCGSHCVYCGFNRHNRIRRMKLSPEQMETEMARLAQTGIENILLLTGESPEEAPLPYLSAAIGVAKKHFSSISLEIYPMETEDYRHLFAEGADGVTVYQETYDRLRYQEVHLEGKKRDYDYRFQTPARAAASGMRQISMGILLGLGDAAQDLFSLYEHMRWMEKQYPGIEYSFSFPRLQRINGLDFFPSCVSDAVFTKIICLSRVLFPRVGINLSTRENSRLRDNLLGLGVTRLSAGSVTSVGGYAVNRAQKQDPQFDIADPRPVADIIKSLKARRFDPVLTDWRRISNETLDISGFSTQILHFPSVRDVKSSHRDSLRSRTKR